MNDLEKKSDAVPASGKKKRRIARVLLFIVLAILLFFVLAVFSIQFLISTGQVQQFVASRVRKNFHRDLRIDAIKFRLLRGIELTNVSLVPIDGDMTPGMDEFPVRMAQIEKVTLKYSLSALFRKKIKITEIWVENPELEIFATPAPADSLPTVTPSVRDTSRVSSTKQSTLPLSFELDALKFRNARLRFQSRDSLSRQNIFLGDLDFYIDDLQLPRGDLLQQSNLIRGRISLLSQRAPFAISRKVRTDKGVDSLNVSGRLQLSSILSMSGLDSVLANMRISVDQLKIYSLKLPDGRIEFPDAITVNLASKYGYSSDSLSIDSLALSIGRQNWLMTRAMVRRLQTNPMFSFQVTRGAVPVKQLVKIARTVLPDSMIRPIYLPEANSSISLVGTRVNGWLSPETGRNEIRVRGRFALKDFGFTYNYGQFELVGLNLTANVRGSLTDGQMTGLSFIVDADYDTVAAILNDSSRIFTGRAMFHSQTSLNDQFVPLSAKGSMAIENILGATLRGEYNISSPTHLKALRGGGHLSLTDIDLARFPDLPVTTTSNIAVNFFVHTLDTLRARISVETDSIRLSLPNQARVFPPLHLTGQIMAGTDPAFKDISLRSVVMNVNDIFIGQLSGYAHELGRGGFALTIPSLYLKHTPLLAYLPPNLMYRYENLSISGRSNLKAKVTGHLDDAGRVHYRAMAKLYTTDTNIDYPDLFLTVAGLHLEATAHASADSGSNVDITVTLDSVRTESLPHPLTISNNSLGLQARMGRTDTIVIENGHFSFPTLKAMGQFTAQITNLSSNPETVAHLQIDQDLSDSLRLMPEVILAGSISLQADVTMDTSVADFRMRASVMDFSAFVSDTIRITDIDANLRLSQRLDLVHQKLIGPALTEIYTPTQTSIDYLTYRPYYRSELGDLSTLSIGRIQVLNYTIDHFKAELLLGKGFIEIPSFLADLYGGNIGGRFSINLAGGDLTAAQYNLSAHFSGINSSLLLPQQGSGKVKKSVINANMKLFGRGLDPESGIDIGGYFYVTDIGPKVLSNLLKVLEAQRTDSGIGYTQNLISWGFKPKLVSFVIKNGYFYPSIFFAQPWYFPAHLSGGRVELARIPVMFFVQTARQSGVGMGE